MAQFQRHFVQELTKPLIVRQCGDLGFTGDNLSDVISVDLYTDGEAYSGGGTCAGACICPDGSTVALTGSVSGKTASVTLKEDCFAIPGQIGIGIRVTTGTAKTTVLKCIYNVDLFATNNPVDPGSRIALDVGDLINRIDAAVESIPASADQLKAAMAPNFSNTTPYPAGTYVWNNGTLYKFTTAHAAGSWTGTDATAVALGNDVADLKSALNGTASINAYKPTDFTEHNNITKNGITYTWQTDGSCIVSGTSTSNAAYTNMYENKAVLPWYFVPGESYDVIYSSTNVDFYINFFTSDGTTSVFEEAYKANTTFVVPSEAHGAIVRLRVRNGKTANETVKPIIAYGKTNNEITTQLNTLAENIDDITSDLSTANDTIEANNNSASRKFDHSLIENKYYVTDYTDQTDVPNKNGVAYTWNSDGSCTCVGATTDSPSWVDLYNNSSALPVYMQSGKSYQLIYTGTNVRVYVAFYASGSVVSENAYTANTVITVPNNTDGLILRLHVLKNKTVDETVKPIILYNPGVDSAKATNVPLMFSIIDDDTLSEDFVTKFHDNCLHMGVVGNYAIITKNIDTEVSGTTQSSTIKTYEEEGFGMLVHCYNQLSIFKDNASRDLPAVKTNMARAIREIREMNLLNAERFWVTPYGVHDTDITVIGRRWFDCLISTGSHVHNKLSDYDPYFIKRVDLYVDDTESTGRMQDVEDAADAWATEGGWLIITTHFKDWGSLTWDDTLDSNGYPIGYTRFNTMVQYLLNKGGVCVNFPEGFSYFKNIYGYNLSVE